MKISDTSSNRNYVIAGREYSASPGAKIEKAGAGTKEGYEALSKLPVIETKLVAIGRVPDGAASSAILPQDSTARQGVDKSSDKSSPDQRDERQNEAFAKMKIALTNQTQGNSEYDEKPGSESVNRGDDSGDAGQKKEVSAADKLKYLLLPPRERAHAEVLDEMGLTQNDYESMPFEARAKIDKTVSDRLQLDNKASSVKHDDPQQTLMSSLSDTSAAV